MPRLRKSGGVEGPETVAHLVDDAARNNAELCDRVTRAQGLDGHFAPDAWTSWSRTPEYYPDAVTLTRDATSADLLARIDPGPGASVKDSFATLDLARDGFRILFPAEWIARPSGAASGEDPQMQWSAVFEATGLAHWEAAWSEDGVARDRFRLSLLQEPDVVFLRAAVDGEMVGGAILNRSARVVGVSNLFATHADVAEVWDGCLTEIAKRYPELPIVGYEPGGALDAAHRAGFTSIGSLRIWIKD